MAEVRLSDVMAPAFFSVYEDIKRQRHREYWLEGGRGSTKSSFDSIVIVLGLVADPEANAIIYRKVAATLRESVYAQMLWAIDMLGLSSWFQAKLSPLEIIYKPTGQVILFQGADDPGKSKSIKLRRGYFKYLWFEEATEFAGMDDIRTIQASVLRGGGWAATLLSYNPPKSAQNWTNQEVLVPVPGRLVHRSTYLQVPPDWLGASFLALAEALRLSNERAWRHTYLGEVTGTGGQVFDNVILREITATERAGFDRYHNGLDFGFAVDPDAFLRMHYDKAASTLYVLGEIYGARMSMDTLAEKIQALSAREYLTADSADPRMIAELNRRGLRVLSAKKGPGSIEHGMRWLQDLAAIVIDPQCCPNAALEFTGYEYKQDRHGNFLADFPDRDNHTIDAARYGLEGEMGPRRTAKILDARGTPL